MNLFQRSSEVSEKSIACWQIVLSPQFWGIRKMWRKIHLVRQEIKNIGTFYEKWENLIKMPRNFIWFVLSTNNGTIINCRNISINSFLTLFLLRKVEKPDKIAKKFHLIRAVHNGILFQKLFWPIMKKFS